MVGQSQFLAGLPWLLRSAKPVFASLRSLRRRPPLCILTEGGLTLGSLTGRRLSGVSSMFASLACGLALGGLGWLATFGVFGPLGLSSTCLGQEATVSAAESREAASAPIRPLPQTPQEWLTLLNERQSKARAVKIESHWKRYGEQGEVVDEWDQFVAYDDLGRTRIEERGITLPAVRPGTSEIQYNTYVFDGDKYTELTQSWEFPRETPLTKESRVKLLGNPPHTKQAHIESTAKGHALILTTPTPVSSAASYLFRTISQAVEQDLPVKNIVDADNNMLLHLSIQNKQDANTPPIAHRATVSAAVGNRVTRFDFYGDKRIVSRHETDYVLQEGDYRPQSGRQYGFPVKNLNSASELNLMPTEPPPVLRYSFDVINFEIAEEHSDAMYELSFPEKTLVADVRTQSVYTVGGERSIDPELARLALEAREKVAVLSDQRGRSGSLPNQVCRAVMWLGLGALGGVCLRASLVRVLQ